MKVENFVHVLLVVIGLGVGILCSCASWFFTMVLINGGLLVRETWWETTLLSFAVPILLCLLVCFQRVRFRQKAGFIVAILTPVIYMAQAYYSRIGY